MIDAWVLIKKSYLDTLWANRASGLLNQAIRGYWNDVGGGPNKQEVVNVLATKEELDAFKAAHGANVGAIYGWIQGDGTDTQDEGFDTDPAEVLSLMKDHMRGDPPVAESPTLEDPNWGHAFLGQKGRIFAGGFSKGFNKGFK